MYVTCQVTHQQAITDCLLLVVVFDIMNESLLMSASEAEIRPTVEKLQYLSKASVFSKLSFSWISSVISYGNKGSLTQDNLEELAFKERSEDVHSGWVDHWNTERNSNQVNPLGKSLRKAFSRRFLIGLLLDFFAYQMTILTPVIIYFISMHLTEGQGNTGWAVFWLLITPFIRYLRSFFDAHAGYHLTVLGSDIANTVSLGMVEKGLRYSVLCNKKFKMGEISSLLQVDCFRLSQFPKGVSSLVFIIYVIIFGVSFMAALVGISFLAGVIVVFLASAINGFVSRFTVNYQKSFATATDNRMKVTSEVFNNVKFIKVNAWEEYFYDKLTNRREEELKWHRKRLFAQTISTYSMWLTPKLILAATFGTFVALDNKLTPPIAFSIMCLYGYIQFYLQFLPASFQVVTESFNALKRIQNFLLAEEIDVSCITHKKNEITEHSLAISVQNGNFYWDKDHEQEAVAADDTRPIEDKRPDLTELHLLDLNFSIKKGELVAVIGDIGAGKSSLIYSLLGEMKPSKDTRPRVVINGSMSLVTQKPWIMNETVRKNILFGKDYERVRYREVIKFACLQRDFELFTHGDKTMIGEKGATLSGGQKARISFARALYSQADILLLDDLLSAVDVHVGKFLMTKSLMEYCGRKTRILVTHALYYLKYVDKILIMEKGRVVEQGNYEAIRNTARFRDIYSMMMKDDKVKRKASINLLEQEAEQDQPDEKEIEEEIIKEASIHSKRNNRAAIPIEKIHALPVTPVEAPKEEEDNALVNELMMSEEVKVGDASIDLYKSYVKYNGGYLFIGSVLLVKVVWMLFNALTNIWITFWTEDETGNNSYYLNYYILFAVLYGTTAFIRALLIAYASPKMSRTIHESMISNLLFSSLNEFFDRVPLGRIFNRLSKDLNSVDVNLPTLFTSALVFIFFLLTNITVILYVAPIYVFLPVMIIYLISCFYLRRFYSKSSKELTRLQGVSKSPIVSCFSEILSGVTTIRSYGGEKTFYRSSSTKINENKKPIIAKKAAEVWFTIRLTLLSFIVNITALAYVLFFASEADRPDFPARGTLLLVVTLGFDQIMYFLLVNVGNFENQLISLQRCEVFMKLEPERGYEHYVKNRERLKIQSKQRRKNRVSDWPSKGQIQFIDLKCRYRKNLDLVLRGLSVTFSGGHKIGVVGRTGSGKSTIMMCLLRILEAAGGRINIDKKDIANFSLDDLRSKITIILQDPCLFAGTLRENLDPLEQYTDEDLMRALDKCALKELVAKRKGLDTEITENGENLSVGERQLVSIARSILKPTKIVLVDEATANIDVRTESIIYKAMNESFKDSTVITVAHRLNTVINSDRILVLEGGLLKEFDNPQELLKNPESFFCQLYTQSQKENKM